MWFYDFALDCETPIDDHKSLIFLIVASLLDLRSDETNDFYQFTPNLLALVDPRVYAASNKIE
jgi:hypothetical protein